MQIIPAIDIFQGMCVRLAEGEFSRRKDYQVVPRAKAEEFLAAGARRLHVVDLEGARQGHVVNSRVLADLLSLSGMDIQVGGGIRSAGDVEMLLTAGASRVVVGSMAVSDPVSVTSWIERFGPEKFCIALDVRDGVLATHGWQSDTPARLEVVVAAMAAAGVKDFLSTDIRRDGMMSGPNIGLYEELVQSFPDLRWLASGGVRSVLDIAALRDTGVHGVIIGKAIYEGQVDLSDLFDHDARP